MDIATLSQALGLVLSLECMLWMFLGSLAGVFLGAVPGISSGMAVALLLPITYTIGPLNALVFLTCIYVGVGYGGALTAILLNAPGAPENSATTLDGYALTRQGRAGEALGYAIMASLIGGTVSYLALLFGVGTIATVALKFGPSELFLISMMGVFVLGAIGSGSLSKTLLPGLIGLLIGTIGMVPTGEFRATFGSFFLAEGVRVIPVLIGAFVISELLTHMRNGFSTGAVDNKMSGVAQIFMGMRKTWKAPGTLSRSSLIGIIIGIVPAAGATLASFVSYTWAKSTSRTPSGFGRGEPDGIIAAETANNACYGGSLITTLALGIPGGVTTAILLAALTMHGIQPGPRLMSTQGSLVYALIFSALVSQFFMAFLATWSGSIMKRLLRTPTHFLMPTLFIFSVIGAYALRNAFFDVWVVLGAGVIGYWMKKAGYSPAALIMGVVLGPIADNELVRMVQLYGDDWALSLVTRPICIGLIAAFILGVGYLMLVKRRNSGALGVSA